MRGGPSEEVDQNLGAGQHHKVGIEIKIKLKHTGYEYASAWWLYASNGWRAHTTHFGLLTHTYLWVFTAPGSKTYKLKDEAQMPSGNHLVTGTWAFVANVKAAGIAACGGTYIFPHPVWIS